MVAWVVSVQISLPSITVNDKIWTQEIESYKRVIESCDIYDFSNLNNEKEDLNILLKR